MSVYVKKKDPYLFPGSEQGFWLSPGLPETEARSRLYLFWHWALLSHYSRSCARSVGLARSFSISSFSQTTWESLGWASISKRTPLKP